MSDPSQPVNTSAAAFPLSTPPAGDAFPLPPPPAFPMAPPPFDGGYVAAPVAYAPYPQGLAPTQDALVAQTSGLAIASLVCSLAALSAVILTFTIILCIPGIILGHVAWWRISHSNGQLKGKGLAIAGLIIGYIIFALVILLALVVVAVFRSSSFN